MGVPYRRKGETKLSTDYQRKIKIQSKLGEFYARIAREDLNLSREFRCVAEGKANAVMDARHHLDQLQEIIDEARAALDEVEKTQ